MRPWLENGHALRRHKAFLHAFRRHKALLSVDPVTNRGPLPLALASWVPDSVQQYWMLVEFCYSGPEVNAPDAARFVTLPPLDITSGTTNSESRPCLASTFERAQTLASDDYLSIAVTIVRKRDAKCKRIFQYPSPSDSLFCVFSDSLEFDCPGTSELARRAVDPNIRVASGLQIGLKTMQTSMQTSVTSHLPRPSIRTPGHKVQSTIGF